MGSTHFRIYQAMDNAQVTALADVGAAKRRGDISKVVGNIGGGDNSQPLNMEGIHVYESGLDLINDPAVDIVDRSSICRSLPGSARKRCWSCRARRGSRGSLPVPLSVIKKFGNTPRLRSGN